MPAAVTVASVLVLLPHRHFAATAPSRDLCWGSRVCLPINRRCCERRAKWVTRRCIECVRESEREREKERDERKGCVFESQI